MNPQGYQDSTPLLSKYEKTVSYVFTGKLALFPLTILFLATGAGSLLLFGNKPYNGGYFRSEEVYYGLAGVVLSGLCATLIVFLFAWLVVKITFTLSPHQDRFTVEKRGVFRSSKLEFVLSETTLHYFRSHFSEEQAWLGLVVKEKQQFFKIFSWKGRGNQRDRFMRLFQHLQDELIRCQSLQHQQQLNQFQLNSSGGLSLAVLGGLMYWTRESTEIISKQEFTLIGPFSTRLRQLLARQTGNSDELPLRTLSSSSSSKFLAKDDDSSSEAGAADGGISSSSSSSLRPPQRKRNTQEPEIELECNHKHKNASSSSSSSRSSSLTGSPLHPSFHGSSSSLLGSKNAGRKAASPPRASGNTAVDKAAASRKSTALPPIPPPTSSSSRPLCIEDIPIFNYDAFFGHFRFKRLLGRSPLRQSRHDSVPRYRP